MLYIFYYSSSSIIFIFPQSVALGELLSHSILFSANEHLMKGKTEQIYLSAGEWLWLDKTVMDYTKWGQDEPNDHTHGVISTSDGTWKTERWSWYSRPYICKAAKGKYILSGLSLNHNTVLYNAEFTIILFFDIIVLDSKSHTFLL